MDFIFFNEKTGTFIEFTMTNIANNTEPLKAIELFLSSIVSDTNLILPNSLLKLLPDRELDLFLLAPLDSKFLKALERMIFVSVDKTIHDIHEIAFNLDFIGKYDSFISTKGLQFATFTIPTNTINHKNKKFTMQPS